MKKILTLGAAVLAASTIFSACDNIREEADKNRTYSTLNPKEIVLQHAQKITNPGKIYVKDDMILINEMGKGIHLVYNENPSNPKKVGFIKIPGNIDVAVKGDIIYADNYMDLLVLNTKTGEIKRIKNTFKVFEKERKEQLLANSNGTETMGMKATQYQAVSHGSSSAGGSPVGVGGSMARFTIVDNNLYVLDANRMLVYDITEGENPKEKNTILMDFVVETIFPYEGRLFIGGTEGMYIYDNSDPSNPTLLSRFNHAVACDPVVVSGKYAYVTLRDGTSCQGIVNELKVIDISDVRKPNLISTFNMHQPHGLSVQGNTLFLCDGNQGLKVFDITDKKNISKNLKFADRDIRKAYDIIPNLENKTLIVVGKEGIFQYDAINPYKLQRISQITIEA